MTVVSAAGEFAAGVTYEVDLGDPVIGGLVSGGYLSVVPDEEVNDDRGDHGSDGPVSAGDGSSGVSAPRPRRPKSRFQRGVTSEPDTAESHTDAANFSADGVATGDASGEAGGERG
jgi:hypothetical protein